MGNGHSSGRGEKPKKDEPAESRRAPAPAPVPAPAPAEEPASSPADSAHVYEKKKTLTGFINLVLLQLGAEKFLRSTLLDTELGNANNKKYSEAIDTYFERKDASGLNQILQECGERTRFFYLPMIGMY